jgi:hypothetical protein
MAVEESVRALVRQVRVAMAESAGGAGGVSVRLAHVLRVYAAGLDAATLIDLREGIRAGQYSWLHDELAAALRTGAFAAGSWSAAVAA